MAHRTARINVFGRQLLVSRIEQAFGLAGASPKYSATWACVSGVIIQAIHLSMQFGCLA